VSHRATPRRGEIAAVAKGIANIVFVGLVIYLTYFFTLSFATRPLASAPIPESERSATKKIEEQRAEEQKLLTTYGPVNPVTKNVRIPVDRAMELIAAESSKPAVTTIAVPKSVPTSVTKTDGGGAASATPKVAAAVATTKAAAPAVAVESPAPAPAPARIGMAPDQLYRAICIACHDVDGRGAIVRKAMPTIPDLTDAKWQATRTDSDLLHSVLEGKGQFMLPMKDKFALARTDPQEMVAFMRSFQSGKQVIAAATPAQAPVLATASASTPLGPAVSVSPSSPASPLAASPPIAAAPTLATGPHASPILGLAPSSPVQGIQPAVSALDGLGPTKLLSPKPSAAPSPERAARLQAAGEFYRINCLACHGQDGRGTAVRVAMPAIPDFTTREWQSARDNPQLLVSILDGKGVLMPPWRARIAPDLAQDLVAFVRTLGPAGLLAASTPTSEFTTRFKQLRMQWEEVDGQVQALFRP
jgi:mono/diheme cytochrome c family protein